MKLTLINYQTGGSRSVQIAPSSNYEDSVNNVIALNRTIGEIPATEVALTEDEGVIPKDNKMWLLLGGAAALVAVAAIALSNKGGADDSL